MVRFAKSFRNITVSFQKIYNWGTFTDAEFTAHDICNESHPNHIDFLTRLTDNIFNERIVDMGNLAPYKFKNSINRSLTK